MQTIGIIVVGVFFVVLIVIDTFYERDTERQRGTSKESAKR